MQTDDHPVTNALRSVALLLNANLYLYRERFAIHTLCSLSIRCQFITNDFDLISSLAKNMSDKNMSDVLNIDVS